jgi:hypothetical protein
MIKFWLRSGNGYLNARNHICYPSTRPHLPSCTDLGSSKLRCWLFLNGIFYIPARWIREVLSERS